MPMARPEITGGKPLTGAPNPAQSDDAVDPGAGHLLDELGYRDEVDAALALGLTVQTLGD